MPEAAQAERIERRAVRVRGAVQGVGFRPFVHRLARELSLAGEVHNDAAGVAIDVQGEAQALGRFVERLAREAPPLARIDAVESESRAPVARASGFTIGASRAGAVATGVPPDVAVCEACLADLFDPSGRRWRHPFVNCTDCGPRFTITHGLPYDRPNTSMAGFAQCPACTGEYHDPASRRFHAQPNACNHCGPVLRAVDARGAAVPGDDPVASALAALRAGGIVAIKGLGGFHLACDARDAAAVARLRDRKHREAKPFAVMAANVASARSVAFVDDLAAAWLEARERPIVLLPMAPGARALAGVAPGLDEIGVMLPGTPLHWLLFHEAAGRPAGTAWMRSPQELLLVMTSANPGGEPLVVGNEEAIDRLGGIADLLLVHDRDILARCDDSVLRAGAFAPRMVRRARGFVPAPVRLPRHGAPVLALGGYLKNTACVTRGAEAFVSPHVGDLDNAPACRALDEAVQHLIRLTGVRPVAVAHDLHPDFWSTRLAARLAAGWNVPALGVQHHHAHLAAVAAEHGIETPLVGLALDGTGLGSDGAAWGGELLHLEGGDFRRMGHLHPLSLPGGDRAAREPWRMAVAVLQSAQLQEEALRRFGERAGPMLKLAAGERHAPTTTSAGRWFDAIAALLGLCETNAYEGQAAMLLEAACDGREAALDGLLQWNASGVLDPRPLLPALLACTTRAKAAALFHDTLADGLVRWAANSAELAGTRIVALGGGCFLNRRLSRGVRAGLEKRGLRVLEATALPPNDGGLSLGQAAVAAARLAA